MSLQSAINEGALGMERAARRANREYDGWTTLAYAFLKSFIKTRGEFYPFELVDTSLEASDKGDFTQPKNLKAWGAVYRRAQKDGLIKRGSKTAKHPYRHGVDVLVWEVTL